MQFTMNEHQCLLNGKNANCFSPFLARISEKTNKNCKIELWDGESLWQWKKEGTSRENVERAATASSTGTAIRTEEEKL